MKLVLVNFDGLSLQDVQEIQQKSKEQGYTTIHFLHNGNFHHTVETIFTGKFDCKLQNLGEAPELLPDRQIRIRNNPTSFKTVQSIIDDEKVDIFLLSYSGKSMGKFTNILDNIKLEQDVFLVMFFTNIICDESKGEYVPKFLSPTMAKSTNPALTIEPFSLVSALDFHTLIANTKDEPFVKYFKTDNIVGAINSRSISNFDEFSIVAKLIEPEKDNMITCLFVKFLRDSLTYKLFPASIKKKIMKRLKKLLYNKFDLGKG